jgi:hypothetical protein
MNFNKISRWHLTPFYQNDEAHGQQILPDAKFPIVLSEIQQLCKGYTEWSRMYLPSLNSIFSAMSGYNLKKLCWHTVVLKPFVCHLFSFDFVQYRAANIPSSKSTFHHVKAQKMSEERSRYSLASKLDRTGTQFQASSRNFARQD